MFRDEYTNFSFDGLESENFKVWITNENDLKRSMSPNFSDKFNAPDGGFIRYHESTTIDKQDFNLSCVAIDVTLNEWRAISEWLSPLKKGKLRFEWNNNYYYVVKVSKAPSSTMFMKGRIDDVMGQLYIITFDLEFTTTSDWAALGNYAEQNSSKPIDISVYNNEYCIPSIIMRNKYVYRSSLDDQTMYPSGNIVSVSIGSDSKDFIYLTEDMTGIEKIEWGAEHIPQKIVFKWGYQPIVKCWNFSKNAYSDDPIQVGSENIEDIKNIEIKVENEYFSLQYRAEYNEDKKVVLTLEAHGVVDDYSNCFILREIIDMDHKDFLYPRTSIKITEWPDSGIYPGINYTIKGEVVNNYNPINWKVSLGGDSPYNGDIETNILEDGLSFIVPYHYGDSKLLGINASVGDYEWTTEGVKEISYNDNKFLSILDPVLELNSFTTTIGIEDTLNIYASFIGFDNPAGQDIKWDISENDYIEIVSRDDKNKSIKIIGKKATPDKETVQITAKYISTLVVNGKVSQKEATGTIDIVVAPNQIVVTREDGSAIDGMVNIKLGETFSYFIDVVGQSEFGEVIVEELNDVEYSLEKNETNDYILKITAPEDLAGDATEELHEFFIRRVYDESWDKTDVLNNKYCFFTFYRGLELKNIESPYILMNEEDVITIDNCADINYFGESLDANSMYIEWSTDSDLCEVYPNPDDPTSVIIDPKGLSDGIVDLILTCTLKWKKNDGSIVVLDTATAPIRYSQRCLVDWRDDVIIEHNPNPFYVQEIGEFAYNYFKKDSQDKILRIVHNTDKLFYIATCQEKYMSNPDTNLKEKTYGLVLDDYQEYDNMPLSMESVLSFTEQIESFFRSGKGPDIVIERADNEFHVFTPYEEYCEIETQEITYGLIDWLSNDLQTDRESYLDCEIEYQSAGDLSFLTLPEFKYNKSSYATPGEYSRIKLIYDDEIQWVYKKNLTITDKGTYVVNKKSNGNDLTRAIYEPWIESYHYGTEIKLNTSLCFNSLETHKDYPYGDEEGAPVFTINALDYTFWYAKEVKVSYEPRDYVTVELNSATVPVGRPPEDIKMRFVISSPKRISNENGLPTQFIYNPYIPEQNESIPFMLRSFRMTNNNIENESPAVLKSSKMPDNSITHFKIVSMLNETIGYIYVLDGLAYFRHVFENDSYWDELIGTNDYYEFKSHPSYSLINHNDKTNGNAFYEERTLLLRENSNTCICNTGVFNMYPLFFVKGGCKIKDELHEYYSFLTNTNMRDLFVTINSRTSMMLHNGSPIESSYNLMGIPLFKNIKNDNQLVLPSGRPELLKAIFESDEELVYYEENDPEKTNPKETGRRKAIFKINSKPIYGKRDKFAMHIFNEEFYSLVNIYNKNTYNSSLYYDSLKNKKHMLLDSPYVEYKETDGGWKMIVYYRAYDQGSKKSIYYDFIRSTEEQYSSVTEVKNIVENEEKLNKKYVYISICGYKEIDIASEGEDYSVGCQARGII